MFLKMLKLSRNLNSTIKNVRHDSQDPYTHFALKNLIVFLIKIYKMKTLPIVEPHKYTHHLKTQKGETLVILIYLISWWPLQRD